MCFDTAELLNWSILKKVYSQHLKSEDGEPASPLDKVSGGFAEGLVCGGISLRRD